MATGTAARTPLLEAMAQGIHPKFARETKVGFALEKRAGGRLVLVADDDLRRKKWPRVDLQDIPKQ